MKKLLTVIALVCFSQFALAQADESRKVCESKAVGSDGRPLAGAARSAYMRKCMQDATPAEHAGCAAKAVSKEGKPLHGAARSAFMKKCVAESGTK
jgi:hypothetical protein